MSLDVVLVWMLFGSSLVEQAEAKGASANNNKSYKGFRGFGGYGIHSLPWWGWLLLGLQLLVLLFQCYKLYLMCSGAYAKCYLCGKDEIYRKVWDNHRVECAEKHHHQLDGMPKSPGVGCPHCGQRLRIMPKSKIRFQCEKNNVCLNPGGNKKIRNTGDNRFNCFVCDYDLCAECHRAALYPRLDSPV